jgi:arylsulfatase A-like enzyme
MGLVDGELSAVEREVGPPYPFPDAIKQLGEGEINLPVPWNSLTEQQKAFQATKMSLHAAMIDRMDQEIGRVIAQLRKMNAFDNTLIMFLSDNGASAEIMVRSDGHDPAAAPGSAASYLCLGPGWSTVCNTPFRRHKTWVHEGGTSTPLIAHWPQGISSRGELRHSPAHVTDIVPTILELAGAQQFADEVPDAIPSLPGRSIRPLFDAESASRRNEFWWCHEENKAIRVGQWKLVAAKGDPWELYDLGKDRTEQYNVADRNPLKVKQLAAQWQKHADGFLELARQYPQTSPRAGRGKANRKGGLR